MTDRLKKLVDKIIPVDSGLAPEIQAHLDNLTKPKGSLGRLEELAMRYALIHQDLSPPEPRKIVLVFAADHGVTEEGISAFPKEVTAQMVKNFLAGGAGINVLARHVGAEVQVIDIGVEADLSGLDGLINAKVAPGTANMARGPAMSRAQALEAILKGAELAESAAGQGYNLLATGEMGIGNTTPASALTAVICGKDPEDVTGRGTGIGDETYTHKIAVIKKAIETNRPDAADPLGALAAVGGLEIAGICGMVLGAASMGIPVVVDGFISTAGALVAHAFQPAASDYVFASHCSVEQGHAAQLRHMGLNPVLDLNLRLGEGTGAALAMNIIEAGVKIYHEMATFQDASVSEGSEAERLNG